MVCGDATQPANLDPQRQFADRSHTLMQQMFEGLVRFSPEGKLEPALAVSWTRLDPLSMSFELRRGVHFHDGEPFDASAVKFSLERYLDPRTGFPGRAFLEPIRSAEVLAPDRVVIHTSRPDGLLLYRLAAFVLIVPPGYVRRVGTEAFGRAPVGTGPFRFKSWQPSSITMEANPGYWESGFPRVKALEFRWLDADARRAALLSGEVDVVPDLPGTWSLEVTRNPRTSVVKAASWVTYLGTLSTVGSVLAARDLRLALNLAIDRESLIRYSSKGNGHPLATSSMPGEFGRNPSLKPYPYDPERARRIIRGFGPAGIKLRILVKDTAQQVMGIIASQWEQVGVHVDQVITSDATMFADLARGGWDGFFAQNPNPMAHMSFAPGIGVYSRGPFALVRDAKFDAAYEEMVSTLDSGKQEQLCFALDAMLHEQVFNVVTFQQIRTCGVSRRVNFVPSVTGMDHFKYSAFQPMATEVR